MALRSLFTTLFTTLLSLGLCSTPAHADDSFTWTGIDYGMVMMLGETPFETPGMFAAYPDKWNTLFRVEMIPVLRKRTRKPARYDAVQAFRSDDAIDIERQVINSSSIRSTDNLLTRVDVLTRVASYTPAEPGMALTFIAEQLNRPDRKGCYWVTFYDRADLFVHKTERMCGSAGGIGFRNFWFGSVKSVLERFDTSTVPPTTQVVTLTEAEQAEAAQKAADLETRLAQARETAAAREAAQKEEERVAAMAAGKVPADWVTIHVAPEGLATLKQNGVEFVVAKNQAPQATTVVIAGGPSVGMGSSMGGMGQESECETAFGKTACGYNCEVAFGDVKCAEYPGGSCEVAFGKIACGFDCKTGFGDVKCARRPGGRCEIAFGEITCSN